MTNGIVLTSQLVWTLRDLEYSRDSVQPVLFIRLRVNNADSHYGGCTQSCMCTPRNVLRQRKHFKEWRPGGGSERSAAERGGRWSFGP